MNKQKRKPIRASDIMSDRYLEMDGVSSVADALAVMRGQDAYALIIKKRHVDDEFGIVVMSDIARKVLAVDRAPDRVNLYEIMAKPVIGVDPGMDVRYVARLFDHFDLTQAPVMSEGRVIGLISYRELVLQGLAPTAADADLASAAD